MLKYKSIKKEAEAEIIVEKSRFIACARPVMSKEEALDFFDVVRASHKNATHNVPAFVVGEKGHLLWASDDGEPQGTAGPPILQMLQKEDLTNLAVMVTRYFGGIKLGTGGLVRAYTAAAKAVLDAADVCEVHEMIVLEVKLDYSYLGKIQNLEQKCDFSIRSIRYEDMVTVEMITDSDNIDILLGNISNITAGKYEEVSRSLNLETCK